MECWIGSELNAALCCCCAARRASSTTETDGDRCLVEDDTRLSRLEDGKGTVLGLIPNSASLDKDTIDREDNPPLVEPNDEEGDPSAFVVPEILPWLVFLSDPNHSFFNLLVSLNLFALSLSLSFSECLSLSFSPSLSAFGLDERCFLLWRVHVFEF